MGYVLNRLVIIIMIVVGEFLHSHSISINSKQNLVFSLEGCEITRLLTYSMQNFQDTCKTLFFTFTDGQDDEANRHLSSKPHTNNKKMSVQTMHVTM